MASDACSYRLSNTAPLASFCADFDVAGAAYPTPTATPFPTPTATPVYANTGMYRVHDELCTGQGPVLSADPDATKTYVGGVNIDLDRTQLGAAEDLLMVVTYHAERAGDESWPANSAVPTGGTTEAATRPSDTIMPNGVDTALRVDLIGTNSSLDTLMGVPQPRVYSYFDQPSYPIYMQEIATLQDPYGSLRSEQVYIPLSKNGLVDRIRIERIRGSYILYQVDLYRLGDRE